MKYLKLFRVHHYLKNFLIFLPALFNGCFLDFNNIFNLIIAFFSFSFLASIIYIINDINDIDLDRKHEKKKKRPIASGAVSILKAKLIALLLLLVVISLNIFVLNFSLKSISWIILYLLINILYSNGLKNKPIVDIAILSFGFVLRVLYGGAVLNIDISNWLLLTVLSMSFYLSMGKRRNEFKKNGCNSREVLKYYTTNFLDKNMYMFLSLTLVFYSLWASDGSNYMIITVPIVFLICLRYSNNIETEDSFGDPVDVLLSDKLLIGLILVYAFSLIFLIYLLPVLGVV